MRGTINRVILDDFMCYSHIELKPGNHVNLILASNGSGMSSLIKGIILGLGGRSLYTRRGKTLGSYVRVGCSTGRIHIELNNDDEEPIIINRVIHHNSKSSWTLNGSRSSQKEIDGLTKSLNIQVDNLCQVLSQDRIYEFSALTPQALLESTQRFVGPSDLTENHMQLKCLSKLRAEVLNTMRVFDRRNDVLTLAKSKIKRDLENLKKKKQILSRIESLKKDYAWKEYQEQYNACQKLKGDINQSTILVENLQAEWQSKWNSIEQLERKSEEFGVKILQKKQEMQSTCREVDAQLGRIEEILGTVETIDDEHKNYLKYEERKDHELIELNMHLRKLESDLFALNQYSEAEQTKRMTDLNVDLKKQVDLISNINQEENAAQLEISTVIHEVNIMEEALRRYRDVSQMRLLLIQNRDPDVLRAVQWLRQNRNQFKATIHEPMLLQVRLLDPSYADFVEGIIPPRDLLAFICDDLDDMNQFVAVMRQQYELRVSVVYSGPEHPPSSFFKPTMPMEELRKYGFTMFIKDMFTAPEPIMKYLCRSFNIHSVPVGTAQVDNEFENVPLPLFFSDSTKYTKKKSEYSEQSVSSLDPVRPATLLTINDDQQVKELKDSRQQRLNRREELKLVMVEIEKRRADAHKRTQELRAERRHLETLGESKQVLESRIKAKKAKIHTAEQSKIELVTENLRYEQKLKCQMQMTVELHEDMVRRSQLLSENAIEVQRLQLMKQAAHAAHIQAQKDYENIILRCPEQECVLERIRQELPTACRKAERLHREALKLSGQSPPDDFLQQGPTADALKQQISQLQTEADFLYIRNANLPALYEEQQKEIKKVEELIKKGKKQLKQHYESMKTLHEQWLPPLQDIVDKISKMYSNFFKDLGCCGEVLLSKPMDSTAYDQYGITIKVKFRNADPLKELNHFTQSGGERSVATALYMVALQQLTCMPFHIVDEINQGMDPVNERKVFDLLMKITQIKNTAQYFILSPKLLPNLQYPDNISVLTLFTTEGPNESVLDFSNVGNNLEKKMKEENGQNEENGQSEENEQMSE